MRAGRVSVVGLGLMGGSLARALAARGVQVIGYDRDADSLAAAVKEGIVHEPLDDTLAGIEQADVVVFATPVGATAKLLTRTLHAKMLRRTWPPLMIEPGQTMLSWASPRRAPSPPSSEKTNLGGGSWG